MESNALLLRNPGALPLSDFSDLADLPPEVEWFANLDNANTKKAYERDVTEFLAFATVSTPSQLRQVSRAHVIAWRTQLEGRGCEAATIRRKLAALSSLFKKLCEDNAVLPNPVAGVKRPKMTAQEGLTPALSDEQTRRLLTAPATSRCCKRWS